jgi:hypothetical protein
VYDHAFSFYCNVIGSRLLASSSLVRYFWYISRVMSSYTTVRRPDHSTGSYVVLMLTSNSGTQHRHGHIVTPYHSHCLQPVCLRAFLVCARERTLQLCACASQLLRLFPSLFTLHRLFFSINSLHSELAFRELKRVELAHVDPDFAHILCPALSRRTTTTMMATRAAKQSQNIQHIKVWRARFFCSRSSQESL